MQASYINALGGGLLIGISASILLLLNGRIAGISDIFNGILTPQKHDVKWRWCFIIALPVGAFLHGMIVDVNYYNLDSFSPWLMMPAGFLVGFGTRLGGGCTSGHGVCGLGRLSLRSLAATLTFITTAMLTLFIVRHVLGAN
ncbi:MAG: putative membrane protein YedE/YeeE [Gammaproteobacteria bacterium]|jgi:uncharacterized membrane protein YedE/YeeE